MKTNTLCFTLSIAALFYGVQSGIAQSLSLSAPIVTQLSEIDRYEVREWSSAKTKQGAWLGLPFRNMKRPEVDELVKSGTLLNRAVWVMNGDKVIAKCKLMGEFALHSESESNTEYGLCVWFNSDADAQAAEAKVRLVPNLDELIERHRKQLDNQRTWIF